MGMEIEHAAATEDSSSAVFDGTETGGTETRETQGGQQQQQTDPTKTTTQPPDVSSALAELALNVNKLATSQSTQQNQQTQQTQQQRQRTPEENEAYWAVYNPLKQNPNFVKEFFNLADDVSPAILERQTRLLASMQEGFTRQSVIGVRNLLMMAVNGEKTPFTDAVQKLLGNVDERIAPVQSFVTQAQAEKVRDRFFGEYESLKEPQYARIIDAAAASQTMLTKKFSSETEYFKALAETAGELIKGVVPDFDLKAKPTKRNTNTPRLPRTSAGGTGGSGSGGGSAAVKTTDDDSDAIDWSK